MSSAEAFEHHPPAFYQTVQISRLEAGFRDFHHIGKSGYKFAHRLAAGLAYADHFAQICIIIAAVT